MSHKIKLSRELIDQIIFGMENQGEEFYLDLAKGVVQSVSRKEEDSEETQVPLPPWKPSDGFQMMDKFVSSLNNPIYKDRFKQILHSGKGVFRKFKDLLKERNDLERLWHRFKQREMQSIILKWLERYEEYLELSHLGREPEWIDELIQTDFVWENELGNHLEELLVLDKQLWEELFADVPNAFREEMRSRYRGHCGISDDDINHYRILSDAEGNLASFLWFQESEDVIFIRSIYTKPVYRGMGLATQLISHLLEELDGKTEYSMIEAAPVASDPRLEHLFHSLGFSREAGGFILFL